MTDVNSFRSVARPLVLAVLGLSVTGCFLRGEPEERTCEEVREYQRSRLAASVTVPEGLVAIESDTGLVIPEVGAEAPVVPGRCLELPPDYFRTGPEAPAPAGSPQDADPAD